MKHVWSVICYTSLPVWFSRPMQSFTVLFLPPTQLESLPSLSWQYVGKGQNCKLLLWEPSVTGELCQLTMVILCWPSLTPSSVVLAGPQNVFSKARNSHIFGKKPFFSFLDYFMKQNSVCLNFLFFKRVSLIFILHIFKLKSQRDKIFKKQKKIVFCWSSRVPSL